MISIRHTCLQSTSEGSDQVKLCGGLPKLLLVFHRNRPLDSNGSLGRGVKMHGNPDPGLKPEEANSWDAGIEQHFAKGAAAVSAKRSLAA